MTETQTTPRKITENEWKKIDELFRILDGASKYIGDIEKCNDALASHDRTYIINVIDSLGTKYKPYLNQISQYESGCSLVMPVNLINENTSPQFKSTEELKKLLRHIKKRIPLAALIEKIGKKLLCMDCEFLLTTFDSN